MNNKNRKELLLINKLKNMINVNPSQLRLKEIDLKNTLIQKMNKNNVFKNQIYQFNNENTYEITSKDRIVSQLLEYYFSSGWGNNGGIKIITSKPIYKHTNDKVNIIIFVYKYMNPLMLNHSKSSSNHWWRLIENMFNSNENLTNIIQNIYNKEVEIEPIILKYDYMDSSILSRGVSDNVLKYFTFKGKYYQNMQYNINLIDTYQYMLTYNNYIENVKSIINSSNDGNGIKLSENNVLNVNMIWSLLLNKYISGYSFEYNGKLAKSDSNARTIHYKKINGTLKSIHRGLNTKTWNNGHNVNKNGKNNTKIILNHV